jgi:hypothetical protein
MKKSAKVNKIEIEMERSEGNGKYILVEEMAMDSPIESVLEGSPVQDPNPLPLCCSTS